MTGRARYRSWRFVLPDFGAERRAGLGIRLDPTGAVEMVEDAEAVRQAILILLSTIPGERVMRPDYGCHIHRLVFAPNDDTTAGLAIHYVSQALRRWEPRITLLGVDAKRAEEDPGRLNVVVRYQLKATQERSEITIPFSLERGTV